MPGDRAIGFSVVRKALREEVEETSIRVVAEDTGMSPSGLHVLLQGSKPHPSTRNKLVAWYVRRRRRGAVLSADDHATAAALLTAHVLDASNARVRKKRLETLGRSLAMGLGSELTDQLRQALEETSLEKKG